MSTCPFCTAAASGQPLLAWPALPVQYRPWPVSERERGWRGRERGRERKRERREREGVRERERGRERERVRESERERGTEREGESAIGRENVTDRRTPTSGQPLLAWPALPVQYRPCPVSEREGGGEREREGGRESE
jgi:hypothetical protein